MTANRVNSDDSASMIVMILIFAVTSPDNRYYTTYETQGQFTVLPNLASS